MQSDLNCSTPWEGRPAQGGSLRQRVYLMSVAEATLRHQIAICCGKAVNLNLPYIAENVAFTEDKKHRVGQRFTGQSNMGAN